MLEAIEKSAESVGPSYEEADLKRQSLTNKQVGHQDQPKKPSPCLKHNQHGPDLTVMRHHKRLLGKAPS